MGLVDKKRATQMASDQALIDGLTKHEAAIGTIVVGTKPYTVAQAIAILQTCLTASKQVVINHSTLEASLVAEDNARTQNKPFVDGLTQTLQVMFAGQVDQLADFSLKGKKAPVVTPATRVAAAQKAKATREARGTKGPKARLQVQAAAAPAADPATEAPPAGQATPPAAPATPPAGQAPPPAGTTAPKS
ncbi:MAG TPA: hypothetical protein VGG39_32105 [Polyangiaceae bacterium]